MKTKTKQTHTPGPWTLHPRIMPDPPVVYHDGSIVATVDTSAPEPGEREANARLIVRAVNSHEELLEALKICLFYFNGESIAGRYVDVPAGCGHDISMEGLLSKVIAKADAEL